MAEDVSNLFTASRMAKELGVSDAKVKKAITELGLVPVFKKGCCTYFSPADIEKIKALLK